MEGEQAQVKKNTTIVWDSGSALYDSFELESFKRQLDAAIVSRSLSMPHFSDTTAAPAAAPVASTRGKQSKISRSFSKLLRSVFRLKPPPRPAYAREELGFYSMELGRGGLSTIPEASEHGFESPEFGPVVRKTASERFSRSPVPAGVEEEFSVYGPVDSVSQPSLH